MVRVTSNSKGPVRRSTELTDKLLQHLERTHAGAGYSGAGVNHFEADTGGLVATLEKTPAARQCFQHLHLGPKAASAVNLDSSQPELVPELSIVGSIRWNSVTAKKVWQWRNSGEIVPKPVLVDNLLQRLPPPWRTESNCR
ncbi:hypothetical protein DES53_104248 [Roseimicrobium gellanilyticum]|uniref:Uncharacterized protein n=1 Tax=Roseimicrobium gellanilyticum TaxID=748857 RepID=A0A366HMP5_9BACT|nr:hypothetical protein DES53_104248 [Roseimicrobium gellanilyticum]